LLVSWQMETAPAITIVVPCHNHGHLLAEAVGSAVSSRSVEVVVIDDGSTDCTAEVISGFEPAAGVAFHSIQQANIGLAAARNRGLQESRGEYIVFLDADDRLTPDGLDCGAAALDAHPESAYVFGRCLMMTRDGALMPTPSEPQITGNHYRELLQRNYIGASATVMFRRDAVERAGGFNPAVDATADYELYLHIARHHPVYDHAQLVAHHRTHAPAANADLSRKLRETLAVLREQRPFLEGDDASLDAYEEGWRRWRDIYGGQLESEIRAAAAAGHWMDAAAMTFALARYDPRRAARQAAQSLKVRRRGLSAVK
jgi:glycosyltransferase involved in cell wall biosynthesis